MRSRLDSGDLAEKWMNDVEAYDPIGRNMDGTLERRKGGDQMSCSTRQTDGSWTPGSWVLKIEAISDRGRRDQAGWRQPEGCGCEDEDDG